MVFWFSYLCSSSGTFEECCCFASNMFEECHWVSPSTSVTSYSWSAAAANDQWSQCITCWNSKVILSNMHTLKHTYLWLLYHWLHSCFTATIQLQLQYCYVCSEIATHALHSSRVCYNYNRATRSVSTGLFYSWQAYNTHFSLQINESVCT